MKQLGQGMTEYIIIVALIAIAAITVYGLFGDTMRSQVGGMAQELSGQSGQAAIQQSQGSAGNAVGEGANQKRLGSYNN